jgi:thioredoxin-related protein
VKGEQEKMKHVPCTLRLSIGLVILCGLLGCGQDAPPASPSPRPAIYDEAADARQDIQQAIADAGRDGKHILLMFGGNWCGWCHALHGLFQSDQAINELLAESYILVMVDVGKRDKNLDLNEQYGNPYQHGFPVLVVLDGEGTQLTTQETGSLEKQGGGHDPDKVLAFLQQWQPPTHPSS